MTKQKGIVPMGERQYMERPYPTPLPQLRFLPTGQGRAIEAFHGQMTIQFAFWKVPSRMLFEARVEVRRLWSHPWRGDSTGPGSRWQREERRVSGQAAWGAGHPGAEACATEGTRRGGGLSG